MKNAVIMVISVFVSTAVFFTVLRYMAPGLLGMPSDMQIVQLDEKVPPFYENIFRREDVSSKEFMLKDPLMRVRARPFHREIPFMGPHDVLGFRNRSVPFVADIVTIGDSQTYGNNAFLEENWPSWMLRNLDGGLSHYSMAVGGWGATQYLNSFYMAAMFKPRVIVVAFYMGNDSADSFSMAYNIKEWGFLKPDVDLSADDLPKIVFPPPENETWSVEFLDGSKTVLSPNYRLSVNLDDAAINAGYEIMANVAGRISDSASDLGIKVFFTIIPTKETVYLKKIVKSGITVPPEYDELINRERINSEKLSREIKSLPGAVYVNVIEPLQKAAVSLKDVFPSDSNGHPLSNGYRVIGRTIAEAVSVEFRASPEGLVAVNLGGDRVLIYLIRDSVAYYMDLDVLIGNGWDMASALPVSFREIETFPKMELKEIDPERFGPRE